MDNSEQVAFWNGRSGERWASLQDSIDRNLGHITQGFIPFVDAKPGERVLDIGCGCGTTTLTFGIAVRPDGSVAGIDISQPMLAVARARAAAGNADIPFIEGDASTHDFQPVFDLVVSRFGVMFFADPVSAFGNIRQRGCARRAACFRVLAQPCRERLGRDTHFRRASLLPPQEPVDPHAPGPFAFAEKTRLRGILAPAGSTASMSRNSTATWKWARPRKTPRVKRSISGPWRVPPPNPMKRSARKSALSSPKRW